MLLIYSPIYISCSSSLGLNLYIPKPFLFSIKDDKNNIYFGKLNELGEQDDTNALFIEEGNKIFKGKINKGNMIEGRNIFLNDKYEKTKAYYFTRTKDENGEHFEFDKNKNEEKDDECIKKTKEILDINYAKNIQDIFNEINLAFDNYKNYEKAFDIDFNNDIKNKIKIIF